MGDAISNGPEIDLASQGLALENKNQVLQNNEENKSGNNNEGIVFYKSKDGKFEVFAPSEPNIPPNEGLHVKVSGRHDETDVPKEVLVRYLMAECVAKEIAGLEDIPDFWPNTRKEAGQVISIYGMIPTNEKIWGKPVNTLDRNVPEINTLEPNYNTKRLQKISAHYLSQWEELANNMELFKNGVNGRDENIVTEGTIIIWENEKIKLEVIKNPHLKGVHLMISPKEVYYRQWHTVTGSESQPYLEATMETMAIAMGAQELLVGKEKGELHTSGNWNKDLKPISEGGKIDFEKLKVDAYVEKRLHRPDLIPKPISNPKTDKEREFNKIIEQRSINTEMHTHVYIPNEGPVILLEMSKEDAINRGRKDVVKQWEDIPSTSPTQIGEIRAKLGEGKLTRWLEENCKGKLYV